MKNDAGGVIHGGGAITISGNKLSNIGSLSGVALSFDVPLENEGQVRGSQEITKTGSGPISNSKSGVILSNCTKLHSSHVDNDGYMEGTNSCEIHAGEDLTNGPSALISGGILHIRAHSLTNRKVIAARSGIILHLHSFSNPTGTVLYSGGDLTCRGNTELKSGK